MIHSSVGFSARVSRTVTKLSQTKTIKTFAQIIIIEMCLEKGEKPLSSPQSKQIYNKDTKSKL